MIRISKDMMVNPETQRNEPSDNVLKKHTESLRMQFVRSFGWRMTDLAKQVMPVIARRACDLYSDKKDWDDARKGVAMLGNVGTGKTILLNYAAYIIDVTVFNVPELSRIYAMGGADAFWNRVMDRSYIKTDMMLDDLGAESDDAKRFGVPFPIVDLIYRRYDIWRSHGHRLWVSSNLTGEELATRYGARVTDRLREMCVVVPAVVKSLRR